MNSRHMLQTLLLSGAARHSAGVRIGIRSFSTSSAQEGAKSYKNIGIAIDESTNKYEHKDVIVVPSQDVRHTYLEMKSKVDGYACGFIEGRLGLGQVFVGILPDNITNLYTFLAATRAGVTYVPLPSSTGMDTFVERLKSTKAKGLIMPEKIGNRHYPEEFEKAVPEIASKMYQSMQMFKFPRLPTLRTLLHTGRGLYPCFTTLDTIQVTHPIRPPLPGLNSQIGSSQPALLVEKPDPKLTPKEGQETDLTPITHGEILEAATDLMKKLRVTTEDRLSMCAPFAAGLIYPIVLGCITQGAVYIQATSASSKFDADAALQSVHRDKATILILAAKDLPAIVNHPRLSKTVFDSLRTIAVAGEIPAEIKTELSSKIPVKEIVSLHW